MSTGLERFGNMELDQIVKLTAVNTGGLMIANQAFPAIKAALGLSGGIFDTVVYALLLTFGQWISNMIVSAIIG